MGGKDKYPWHNLVQKNGTGYAKFIGNKEWKTEMVQERLKIFYNILNKKIVTSIKTFLNKVSVEKFYIPITHF